MEKYTAMMLHVPVKSHDRLLKAITRSTPVSIKLDLTASPDHKIFVTSGQRKKIETAVAMGRRDMTLRFSARQVKCNHKAEGGFLGAVLAGALRFLPAILAGLAAGSAEHHSNGNGMFLGKRDHTYQIRHSGEGLLITPAEHNKIRGFYVKHGEKIFQGKGLLHGLFSHFPLLNILF